MGGVVEGGVGVGKKTSPQRAIEKVQAELRQEYDVREERRRELEFLEKGGNPLDFKLGNATSLSVQSTSLTDQHPDQFVSSEAKGSFAASPHADSVESSGRPGAPPLFEPNSADNLMLFDGDNELAEVDRNLANVSRSGFSSERSSQLDVNHNVKELKDSAALSLPRKAYKRRSRPNRDAARTGSVDAVLVRGGHGSSLSSGHAPLELKGLISDPEIQKDQNVPANGNSTPTSPNRVTICDALPSDNQLEMDGVNPSDSTACTIQGFPDAAADANASKSLLDTQNNLLTSFSGQKSPIEIVSEGHENFHEGHLDSTGLECHPGMATTDVEDQACHIQMNGISSSKGDRKILQNDDEKSSAALGTTVLDSESYCIQTCVSLDGSNDKEMYTQGAVEDQKLVPEQKPIKEEAFEFVEEKKEKPDDCVILHVESNSFLSSHQKNGLLMEPDEELRRSASGFRNHVKNQIVVEGVETSVATGSETERKHDVSSIANPITQSEAVLVVKQPGSIECPVAELPEATTSALDPAASQKVEEKNDEVVSKIDNDSILEEALIIEAKRKRIAELSGATFPMEYRRKSHWDYVLEEMAWLANDFAQERLWKISAAAQICHRVAVTSRLRFQEQHFHWEQKRVAHVLSKAVTEFWLSVEETSKDMVLMHPKKDSALAIQEYAVRFLKFNSSEILHNQAEAPVTPDRISDFGIMDMAWEDHLTEENLFYTVPSGAMEAYRKSIGSHVVKSERNDHCVQEEVETSACDAVTEFGSTGNNVYEEEEGEASTYDCAVSKSSRFAQRKPNNLTKGYGMGSYEVGANSMYTPCLENNVGTHQSVLMGKRPASSLNVSIPTKRVRTASRQRVISPFTGGTSGFAQLPVKTDASSGDTSSFQDDHSAQHGGLHMPNSMEVESVGNFEKHFPFDSTEVSKPRKKKKAKNLVSAYEQRWQVDSHFQNEQRDYSKKKSQSHQLESNGSGGLFGQHVAKKPKMMRPTLDTSFDNIASVAGSVPSPVASQMSNMSNPNKLIKLLGGRDRGRKAKALKVPAGQQGSGRPWSVPEDQALVVLVHDMGPNWELVSDAINSTLQFMCIYRKPKECSERHKILMDRTSGDGADSAEDSGSSQPYPSTLPGIPKGSARLLLQHLQGPDDIDTIKSRFGKIIMIMQKQHYRKTQNDNHDSKQQPHSSHMLALSQVCPNNLKGGPVLTPIDLCEETTSSSDSLPLGLPVPNQGTVSPMLPATAGVNSALQGSTNTVLGNNYLSSPGSMNSSARFGGPRPASLSIDEQQQRMHQYNQMLSSRNTLQPNLSTPGAIPGTDRGMRMLPTGNGLASVGGVNRNAAMARPGFQAMASSSMLNSGSMLSSGMVAIPSPVNMHSGPGRPRDAMHMKGPSQNQEPQRQLLATEIQMQVSQANTQGVGPYGGASSSFPNQIASPPVSPYPFHHHQPNSVSSQQPHMVSPHQSHLQGTNNATNAHHQAYAMRIAKEKHLKQRLLQQQQQQQQQQFAVSNPQMPHPQSQLPVSSPLPNSSQIHPQAASPPASFSPSTTISSIMSMPQHQQKHQMPPQAHMRNPQTGGIGLTNQIGKQRQRQPQQQQQQQFQQAGRHHPQQRQQSQSQLQNKLVKGVGRGNMVIQQHIPIDPSLRNGLSTNSGNQSNDRGEQAMQSMQGQGLYAGSALNPVQNAKQSVPPSNQSQPKQVAPASKHVQQMPSHSDTRSQGNVTPVPTSFACNQSAPLPSSNIQQPQQHPQLQVQSHQKLLNQNPSTSQRVPLQNRKVNSEQPNKLQTKESQSERPMSSSSHLSTAVPLAGNDAINGTQVPCASQRKSSEQLHESAASTAAEKLISGTHPTNTSISGPVEGLGQRLSSGSLPSIEQTVNEQGKNSPSLLQQPPLPLSQPEQHKEQLPSAQHSEQEASLVQAGNDNVYVTPGGSRLD